MLDFHQLPGAVTQFERQLYVRHLVNRDRLSVGKLSEPGVAGLTLLFLVTSGGHGPLASDDDWPRS